MPKYRKRPVVIEAYQTDKELDIVTLEGTMHANVGDYIITGVEGEQYPVRKDIFEKTYEAVKEDGIDIKKIAYKLTQYADSIWGAYEAADDCNGYMWDEETKEEYRTLKDLFLLLSRWVREQNANS